MRLINTKTFLLESIYTQVPYAILSHTWGPEEISFQEWEVVHDSGAIQGQCPHTQKMSRPNVTRKKGYEKVIGACQQAARDGIKYLWCDTNCIDKTSSAELSEAINSMFSWYRNSQVCYVLLTDVQVPDRTSLRNRSSSIEGWFARYRADKDRIQSVWNEFPKSRWWTRGWTLQELLAPKHVVFFAQDWSPLGRKSELSDWILSFTTIHKEALQDANSISGFSVAQRMSWAAERCTTVPEDMAYCLLGIFEINMPLLYGQGGKAFLKLQEEIIKISDDQSILAWDYTSERLSSWGSSFAPSPAQFRMCGSISKDDKLRRWPYSITNHGISMKVLVLPAFGRDLFLAELNCWREIFEIATPGLSPSQPSQKIRIWIPLRRYQDNMYERIPFPCSKILLEGEYSLAARPTPTDIYMTLRSSRAPVAGLLPLGIEAQPSRWNPDLNPSGLLLQFCSGDVTSTYAYRKSKIIPAIYTATLRPRGKSTISHQIVLTMDFTILLSIAWDYQHRIQSWESTVLKDQDRKMFRHVAQKIAHDNMYAGKSSVDTVVQIHMEEFHQELRTNYPIPRARKTDSAPLVNPSKLAFQDFHGEQELVVDIILRQGSDF